MGRRTKKQRGGEAGKLSSRRVEKRKDRKTDEQRDGRVKRSDIKLSVAVATFNEAENLERCLKSVAGIADEIVVVDGGSADKTVEIAKSYGARVEVRENPVMFHINKQRAIDLCRGKWVLQLDADEAVSEELADEIRQVVGIQNPEFSIQNRGERWKGRDRQRSGGGVFHAEKELVFGEIITIRGKLSGWSDPVV
jgi:glycosyltransferase involved in cell wall biosynthesis